MKTKRDIEKAIRKAYKEIEQKKDERVMKLYCLEGGLIEFDEAMRERIKSYPLPEIKGT